MSGQAEGHKKAFAAFHFLPCLSVCYSAWLRRAEAAADEKNETDFLHYPIKADDREAFDMREHPSRWLRPGWAVMIMLYMRMPIALLRQCPQRAGKRRAVIGLVAVAAVDEVIGLACCFLSYHFHTDLLRWMATCQFASGCYGVSCVPSVAMSSSIWKGTVAAVVILCLHMTAFRKKQL